MNEDDTQYEDCKGHAGGCGSPSCLTCNPDEEPPATRITRCHVCDKVIKVPVGEREPLCRTCAPIYDEESPEVRRG